MSLWKDLCNDAQALISGLDNIADQIDRTFNNRVIPAVQNSIVWIGQTLHGAAERLEVEVESTVLRLDDNYQQFVIRQIDPVFGQNRTKQLSEVARFELTPAEAGLNRRVFFAGFFLGISLLGKAFFPASLLIIAPVSFYVLMFPIFGMAYRALKQRRISYHVLSAVNVTCLWPFRSTEGCASVENHVASRRALGAGSATAPGSLGLHPPACVGAGQKPLRGAANES